MRLSISWASKRARDKGVERSIGSGLMGVEAVGLVRWRRVLAWDCGVKVGERRVGRERWEDIWRVEAMGRVVDWGVAIVVIWAAELPLR